MIKNIENLFSMAHSLIALSIALVMFLSEYLLYRFDHDECSNDRHIREKCDGNEYDKSECHSEDDMKE